MVSLALAVLLASSLLVLAGPASDGHHGNDQGNRDRRKFFTDRIKYVVVLVEENRSHDTVLGGSTYNPNIEGLVNRKFCNPVNLTDPSQGTLCASPTLGDTNSDDPNHGISGVNRQVFGTYHPSAEAQRDRSQETMLGFLAEQETTFNTNNITRASEALDYYDPANIPVLESLAENFVVFAEWFCAVPGPTNPNRAYITAGTSHGHGRNDRDFLTSKIQLTSIFQQVDESNRTWINYSNASTFLPDSLFYSWTVTSGRAATNVKPISQFFTDAENGNLPQFTYINPECCSYNSFHPPGPTTSGEKFVKQIYEALRSSPQWEDMLFIMTFDEHGGFADHVPPPVNVPPGDNLTYTELSPDGQNMTFDFTRLGVRVPTYIISPWVQKGFVVPQPEGDRSYTHTSILATLAEVWDLEVLTPRVEWSPRFDGLIQKEMRDDTPVTLPEVVPF